MKTFTQFLEQRDPELYEQMLNEGLTDVYNYGKSAVQGAWQGTKDFFGEFWSRLKEQFGEFSDDAKKIKQAYSDGKLTPVQIKEINEASKKKDWMRVAKILATVGVIVFTALSIGAGHAHAGEHGPIKMVDKDGNPIDNHGFGQDHQGQDHQGDQGDQGDQGQDGYTKTKPLDVKKAQDFDRLKGSVSDYTDKVIKKFSSEEGKKLLDGQRGHMKYNGSKVDPQLKDYTLHVFGGKTMPTSKVPQIQVRIKLNNIDTSVNKAQIDGQSLFKSSNADGTVIVVWTLNQ